jgi:hypothetical protein
MSRPAEKKKRSRGDEMASEIHMIGLQADELEWVKLLVRLLRADDPVVAELSRQALLYIDARLPRPDPVLTGGIPSRRWPSPNSAGRFA